MKFILSDAVISPCQRFRTRLWRVWSEAPRLLVIMLNPSTADANTSDRTIDWLVRWAVKNEFGGIEVMNVYDYRATDPRELKRAGWPMSEQNLKTIGALARVCGRVVCAWGAHARVEDVKNVLRVLDDVELFYFKMNASGSPAHPLYLPGDVALIRWSEEDRWARGLTPP